MRRLIYSLTLLCLTLWPALCAQASDATLVALERITVGEGLGSNVVSDMLQDADGYVWIATMRHLNAFDGYSVMAYAVEQFGGPIVAMADDSLHGIIALASATGQVASFDRRRRTFATGGDTLQWAREALAARTSRTDIVARLGSVTYRNNGDGTLTRIAADGRSQKMRLIPEGIIAYTGQDHFHVVRMNDGREAISTYGAGLYIYDPATGTTGHITAHGAPEVLRSDYLTALMTDRSGCLWIAEEQMGLAILSPVGLHHERLLAVPGAQYPDMNYVRHIGRGPGALLTVSNNYGTSHTLRLNDSHFAPTDYAGRRIYCTLTDSRGRHWTGTRGGGLCVDGHWLTTANSPLPSMDVYDIAEDSLGRILVATLGGGVVSIEGSQERGFSVKRVTTAEGDLGKTHALEIDGEGRLWVATEGGLCVVEGATVATYSRSRGNLAADYAVCLCRDAAGAVWVGTMGAGLLRCTMTDGRLAAERITTAEGLAANNVYSIVADRHGRIWAGTECGLSRIDTQSLGVANYHLDNRGLGDAYSERAAIAPDDTTLLFGTHKGIVRVWPTTGNEAKGAPTTRITAVEVNGQRGGMLAATTADGTLTTPYDMSTLRFSFSNFAYRDLQSVQYQYYMEPIEADWGQPTSLHNATYAKLPPGSYRLHVRSNDGRGQWGEAATMDITVSEPWWNTTLAHLIYIMVALTLVTAAAMALRRIWTLRRQMEVERGVAELKMSFFANVTHQFTVPLTLIRAATDRLVSEGRKELDSTTLRAIVSNASRLGSMVTKLMQFRKLSHGALMPRPTNGDVVATMRGVCHSFRPMAEAKDVRLVFTTSVKNCEASFDRDMVETILSNLLSNAIRHTPRSQTVTVAVRVAEATLTATVTDDGLGVSQQAQRGLFTPYGAQGSDGGGMGMGLYISSRMAMALGGQLTCTPKTERGARFTLTMPIVPPATADETAAIGGNRDGATASKGTGDATLRPEELMEMMPVPMNAEVRVVLAIDDNETLHYLRYLIGQYFAVTVGTTTDDAIGQATLTGAHLVVAEQSADHDAIALVRALRERMGETTRTIVIAANGSDGLRTEAIKAGADDFFAHPFAMDTLVAAAFRSVETAMRWRETTATAEPPEPQPTTRLIASAKDKRFVDKFQRLLETHAADPATTADSLAAMMKLGRAQFYKRVVEITGATPAAHLREARMNNVARLLSETDLAIDEIRQKAGYSNPSHFNSAFKRRFGMTPSQWRATGGREAIAEPSSGKMAQESRQTDG